MLDAGVIIKRARNSKCAMHNVRMTAGCKTLSHTQSTVFYWLDKVNTSIDLKSPVYLHTTRIVERNRFLLTLYEMLRFNSYSNFSAEYGIKVPFFPPPTLKYQSYIQIPLASFSFSVLHVMLWRHYYPVLTFEHEYENVAECPATEAPSGIVQSGEKTWSFQILEILVYRLIYILPKWIYYSLQNKAMWIINTEQIIEHEDHMPFWCKGLWCIHSTECFLLFQELSLLILRRWGTTCRPLNVLQNGLWLLIVTTNFTNAAAKLMEFVRNINKHKITCDNSYIQNFLHIQQKNFLTPKNYLTNMINSL